MKRLLKLLPIFLLCSFFTSSCVVQESAVSGNKRAYAYSWNQEIQIGQEVDQEISAEYGLYDDNEIEQYVTRLGEDLLEESHMQREGAAEQFQNTEFTFRVLNSPVVNAFALPGGYVYVTRGLLAHLNNEAQLAVVLGHEIGHVAARHASQRALQQQIGQIAVIGGAVLGQELLGLPAGNLLNLSSQAAQLLFLSYSRDHERESDALGVEYSAMNGFEASEGAAFFTSLKRISEKSGQSIPSLLSSHPDPGERESNIPEMAQEWENQGYEQTKMNTENYMRMVEGIIYGDNPREGFVTDGNFVHPDMEFMFSVNDNWQVINQPTQVVMVSPSEDAVMIFRMDGESTSAQQSVEAFTSQEGISVQESGATQSSDQWSAYQAIADLDDGEQPLTVHVYAVEHGGNIYRFINYTLPDNFDGYVDNFMETTSSFDELTDQNILNIQPVRLQVVEVNQRQTFRNLLPSSMPMDIEAEDLAIINQVYLDDQIEAGTLIKIPVQD